MPSAIDLTIDNGAGTPVNKTFTLLRPSAGDNSLAAWALKEGTISAVFPTITALARPTGDKLKGRRTIIKFKLPSSYTDSVTGLTKVGSGFELDVTATIPDDFPEALKDDAVAFSTNLFAEALIQSMIRDGQPAS